MFEVANLSPVCGGWKDLGNPPATQVPLRLQTTPRLFAFPQPLFPWFTRGAESDRRVGIQSELTHRPSPVAPVPGVLQFPGSKTYDPVDSRFQESSVPNPMALSVKSSLLDTPREGSQTEPVSPRLCPPTAPVKNPAPAKAEYPHSYVAAQPGLSRSRRVWPPAPASGRVATRRRC